MIDCEIVDWNGEPDFDIVASSLRDSNSTINSTEQLKEDDHEYTENIANIISTPKDEAINNKLQVQYVRKYDYCRAVISTRGDVGWHGLEKQRLSL